MIKKISILLLLTISVKSFGQCYESPSGNMKFIKEYMAFEHYTCALKELMVLDKQKPKNSKTYELIAECYLKYDGDRTKALPYLEFIVKEGKFDTEIYLMLGLAYHANEEFDKAIEALNNYVQKSKRPDGIVYAQTYITYCQNAKDIVKVKQKILFENLGKDINSEWNDYNPYVSPDEEYIFYSTNREKTTGNFPYKDGYVSDVFVSQYRGKSFSKSKGMGGMYNSEDVDDFAGGSADGNIIFLTSDKEFQIFNLYISVKGPKARSFPKPLNLDGINGKNTNEMSATINDDQNLIIFSSDRPGGYGGQDLYISKLLPDGTWGAPVNMGPQINSEREEIYPMFTPNQKGIIFSSNNNYSMGGFDLFQTDFSEELKTWTAPKNLGYPVNSPYDDLFITKLPNNKYAYKSASRKDSYGMKDIYRLTFMDSTPVFTVIAGSIVKNDTIAQKENATKIKYSILQNKIDSLSKLKNVQTDAIQSLISKNKTELNKLADLSLELSPYIAEIEVRKGKDGEVYGTYKANINNGKFVLILEPDDYVLNIIHPQYKNIQENVKIYDKKSYTPLINMNFTLRE
jgi:hypothetical protein